MAFQVVTLDAAGTLIYPVRPVAESYAEIARAHGGSLDLRRLGHAFRETFVAMPPMAFPRGDPDTIDRLERGWWRTLVRQVTEAAGGVADFDAYFDTLYGYFAAGDAWQLYPEVVTVLDTLAARSIRLAVVSNFDSRLIRVLQELGIAEHFEHVVYSTAAGSAKPDPAIFARALAALECRPADALHIGDSPDADLDGARAAGMQALLLRRGERGPGAVHEAADLRVLIRRR